MTDKNFRGIIGEVTEEINRARKKAGKSVKDLSTRCAGEWSKSITYAEKYITGYIEGGIGWTRASGLGGYAKNTRKTLIARTYFYLGLIGISEYEKKRLFDKLSSIHPEIGYPQENPGLDSMEGIGEFEW